MVRKSAYNRIITRNGVIFNLFDVNEIFFFFFQFLIFIHSFLRVTSLFESVAHLFVLRARSKRIFLSANNQYLSSCPYLLLPPLFANRLNPLKSSICINTLVREFKRKLKFNLINDSKQKEKCFFLKQSDSFFFFRVLIYSKCKIKILEYTQIIQGSITFSRILFIKNVYRPIWQISLKKIIEENFLFSIEKSNFYLVIQQCLQHFKVICDTMETNYESSTLVQRMVRYHVS